MYKIPVYRIQLVKDSSCSSGVKAISSPADVYDILNAYMHGLDRENFVVLLLDTKNKVIGLNTVSVGTLNSALVHPREVFKPAILSNAASVILGHNHPSGDTTPSKQDIEITHNLVKAGDLLNIAVLDHVIIGDGYTSLKAKGYI